MQLVLRVRKNGNKKLATCLAWLLLNELNSDVARFTTHVKPVKWKSMFYFFSHLWYQYQAFAAIFRLMGLICKNGKRDFGKKFSSPEFYHSTQTVNRPVRRCKWLTIQVYYYLCGFNTGVQTLTLMMSRQLLRLLSAILFIQSSICLLVFCHSRFLWMQWTMQRRKFLSVHMVIIAFFVYSRGLH